MQTQESTNINTRIAGGAEVNPQESQESGQRLDYALALCSGPARPLICRGVQLTRRARGKLLSDHHGIVVDLDVGA